MWKKSWMMLPLVVLATFLFGPTTIFAFGEGNVKVQKRTVGEPPYRRSQVDRLFIRFGRAVRSAEADDFLRDMRTSEKGTGDSFVRFGKAADNFMRFGKGGNKDAFVRFGRPNNGDSFVRFGKAADNFMRFGRAKDNFVRFGRAKDNFMRFGRGKDNFLRFGRAKDNFMRFGKSVDDDMNWIDRRKACELWGSSIEDLCQDTGETISKRRLKGGFVRFGKSPKNEDGFIRFGRADSTDTNDSIQDDQEINTDQQGKNAVLRNKRFSNRIQRDSEEIGQPPVLPDSQEVQDDEDQESTTVTHK